MRRQCPVCKEAMLEGFPLDTPIFLQKYFSYCPKCRTVFYTDDETIELV